MARRKRKRATRYGVGWVDNACLAQRKVRYRTEQDARDGLAQIMEKVLDGTRAGKQPIAYYHCERCDGWHLTSSHQETTLIRRYVPSRKERKRSDHRSNQGSQSAN